jgi:starch synthase (maltosyl-transferring)
MERRRRQQGHPRAYTVGALGNASPYKIYYLPGFLAGEISTWSEHFERIAELGFSQVCLAPLARPGPSGNIFLADDFDQVDNRLGRSESAQSVLAELSKSSQAYGLSLLVDIVLDQVAADGAVARRHGDLFQTPVAAAQGALNPRTDPQRLHAALARFDDPTAVRHLGQIWRGRLAGWLDAGVTGFRVLGLDRVPPGFLAELIQSVRDKAGSCQFLGWTPGVSWNRIAELADVGLDAVFASTPWWDGRESWYVEEHELLRRIAPVVGPVEAPFGSRLAHRAHNEQEVPLLYREVLESAAATTDGLLMPMGFEFRARLPADARFAIPERWDGAKPPLQDDIASAIKLLDQFAANPRDEMRSLTSPANRVTALQMVGRRTLVLINTDLSASHRACDAEASTLQAGEVRVTPFNQGDPIVRTETAAPALKATTGAPRIVVENMSPRVEGGAFAAKRIVGQRVTVEADAYMDGHDVLAIELLWKAADEPDWHRQAMSPLGNARWQSAFTPNRIGRWLFTAEAWLDEYGTLCRSACLKREAGVDFSVELTELKLAVETAVARKECARSTLTDVLSAMAKPDQSVALEALTSPETTRIMAEASARSFAVQHEPLALEVDRREAGFASWYEIFPRSQTKDPDRHATFADVIESLPRVRDMGFDVLYFPPIHPIGTAARKGRNNSLVAAPQDVGSPYAIGSREGGHDAIHRQLGTLDDFRQLVAAARDHGLEIALDFAIQCSPDHPWLRKHPEWFRHRPDGTIKYAENPPKKYEDIVNVDFYADGAVPGLWQALRDIVLFWVAEDVRTFRVDNPHTKPLPFWQWLIEDVRRRYPDVIFLSEAFTHPKMMYRLAKVGFTQSYTYFTWRNTRPELTDYLRELTTTEVAEFFRPHFFVNTPDINPFYLQSSGRAGFLIRAALAATLSGLWGMYSGFEICEAAPLPGREEYLDSEKYAIRVRDFAAPGNIVAEISTLNRIRKANPALQSHLGLSFYNSSNPQVMAYGKALPSHEDMVFVLISLDPHRPQETNFEIPLWEWKLPDSASLVAEDLMTGRRFTLYGKQQWLRLDPTVLPFAIWRLSPDLGGAA